VWRVEGAAAFERGSIGRVGELPGCVMHIYELVVAGFALPALCVQESGSPQSGHASVGACLYLKASLPL
jgi:hypothetical protein